MRIQIKQFSTHQTAKIIAIISAVSSLFFIPIMFIPLLMAPEATPVPSFFFMFVLMPVFYLIFTYCFMRLGLWLYNKLSARFGGFEFVFEETE